MKLRLTLSGRMPLALAAVLVGTFWGACAEDTPTNSAAARASTTASNAAPIEPPIPHSVFVVPTTDKDGKDPFFPRSRRPFATPSVGIPTNPVAPPVVDLKINGTSGSEDRPLVIINNVTFAVGDSNDVISGGRRIRVQCLEIDLASVPVRATVEVSGSRRELYFQKSGK